MLSFFLLLTIFHYESIFDKENLYKQYYKLMIFWGKESTVNNGTIIQPSVTISDINGQLIEIAEIVRGSPKLIIKTSALACDICLEEELKHIKKHINKIGINNIIIIASDYNARSIILLKKNIQIDLEIYRTQRIGIPFEEKNKNLFVFVVDDRLIIQDFFLPEKTFPELSNNYYEIISSKYW